MAGGRASGSGDGSPPPVGSRGEAQVGVVGFRPPELKQNVKLVLKKLRFPVDNLGFNEYRSRAWTVFFANTQYKKF